MGLRKKAEKPLIIHLRKYTVYIAQIALKWLNIWFKCMVSKKGTFSIMFVSTQSPLKESMEIKSLSRSS